MTGEVQIRAPAEQSEGTRSQILRWLKSVGDRVVQNEPLIEIETDKVTVEVAAPGSGTLREILKSEGEEVTPGELLGRIVSDGAASVTARTPSRPQAVQSQPVTCLEPQPGQALEPRRDPPGELPPLAAMQASDPALSPAVRRLLREHGLAVSDVRGTGLRGRITVEDVLRHAHRPAIGALTATAPEGQNETPSAPAAAAASSGASDRTDPRRVPHTATRKRIAEHMVESLLHTAPHVTTVFEADMTAILEHRMRNKEEFARQGAPLTLTAYFLRGAVEAIRAVPEANSRWTDDALEIFDAIHIGVATALDSGLVVPVLRDVQSRDLLSIARGLEDLTSRARGGRLSLADVRDGTFTISNHGVSGSLVAAPIVIHRPQAAILGIGKLEKRAVVIAGDEERIVIRPRCYVTLTIDHRVMDGQQANRFLSVFTDWLATCSR